MTTNCVHFHLKLIFQIATDEHSLRLQLYAVVTCQIKH